MMYINSDDNLGMPMWVFILVVVIAGLLVLVGLFFIFKRIRDEIKKDKEERAIQDNKKE